ncbi:MAG: tetratricopeptide repeat protein [Pseudomonadota bacterium]
MRRFAYALVLASASGVAAPTFAQDAPRDAMRAAFAAVIANPQDVDANLAYARAAIDAGEPRKAVAAYDRVLAVDPDNAEAAAGLARLDGVVEADATGARTTIDLALGVLYETNPTLRGQDQQSDADFGVTYAARLSDSRPIYGVRLESALSAAGQQRADDGDVVDVAGFGLQTGPVFDLAGLTGVEGLSLATQASFSIAWFGDEGFSDRLLNSYGVAFDLRSAATGVFKGATFAYAFDHYRGDAVEDRTARVYGLSAQFAERDLLLGQDELSVTPRLVIYEAREDFFSYREFGGSVAYTLGLPGWGGFAASAVRAEFDASTRMYRGEFNGIGEDRSDQFYSVGARYTLAQWDDLPVALSGSYHYDVNASNVRDFDFDNHRIGLTASMRFEPW